MKTKKLFSVLYFLGFLLALGAFYSFTTNAIDNYTDKEPEWENLKVLPKDISKDSLKHLMRTYSKSLGVNCSHCHASKKDDPKKLDFAADSKMQKMIARGMIQMTDDINKNYFKPHYPEPKPAQVTDVSCVMCHRGTAKPKKYLENLGDLYPSIDKEK